MAISYQTRDVGAKTGTPRTRITVSVRAEGYSVSCTFSRHALAEAWAHRVQDEIQTCKRLKIPFDTASVRPHGRKRTIDEIHADLMERKYAREPDADPQPRVEWSLKRALKYYLATVSPTKKGFKAERERIAWWCKQPLATKRLNEITPTDIQIHINARSGEGKSPSTVRNEVFLLSALYVHACSAPPPQPPKSAPWGLKGLSNPITQASLPQPRPHRDRRLQDGDFPGEQGERERMRDALLSGPGAAEMEAFFTLAIETGMRLGELFSITVGQIRSEGGVWVARLTDTKNGLGRKVTLSTRAIAAVQTLRSTRTKDQKLVAITPGALRYRWDRARRISGVKGLHFHDLRHEGLSLMAQAGLDIGQLQAQSGHKTPGILLTYVNARPSEVAKKLG